MKTLKHLVVFLFFQVCAARFCCKKLFFEKKNSGRVQENELHQKVGVIVRGFFHKTDKHHNSGTQTCFLSQANFQVVISLKKILFPNFSFCFQQKSSVLKALPKSCKFCLFLRSLSNDYSCSVLTSRGTTLENWSGFGKSIFKNACFFN